MAPIVPQSEPTLVVAGDTWAWSKALGNYPPSDGWTLAYSFRGASVLKDDLVVVTPVGNAYSVRVAPASTAPLLAGTYRWQSYVTNAAGDRYTVGEGVTTVIPGLSAVGDNSAQTHAERTLAILEAKIEGRLSADFESYSVNGRAVSKIPIRELVRLAAVYRSKLYRLRNPGQLTVPVASQMQTTDGQIADASPVVLPPWYRSLTS